MPRLLGVEIPAKKKVAYSLRYINGIGPTRADLLVKEAGLNPDMRAQDLTEEQLNKILTSSKCLESKPKKLTTCNRLRGSLRGLSEAALGGPPIPPAPSR